MKSSRKKIGVIILVVCVCFTSILAVRKPWRAEKEVPSEEVPIGTVNMLDINFKNRDGKELPGILSWPVNETQKYPGIVMIGGWYLFGGSVHEYDYWPKFFAENGYVSLLIEPTYESHPTFSLSGIGIWPNDLQDAIDWLIEDSPVKNLVDMDKIGTIGHGLGGVAVTKEAVMDDRVKAVVVLSGADPSVLKELDVPLQIFTGDFDLLSYGAWLLNTPVYYSAKPPKQIIAVRGGTHWGMGQFAHAFMPRPEWQFDMCTYYSLAWFDYYLKGDESAYDRITSPYGELSVVIPSLYNLGDGEHLMAGGKTFWKHPLMNLNKAFRTAPDALEPLLRNIDDLFANPVWAIKSLPGLCTAGVAFLYHLIRAFIVTIIRLPGDMI